MKHSIYAVSCLSWVTKRGWTGSNASLARNHVYNLASTNFWNAEGLNIRRHTVHLVLLMYLIGFSHCGGQILVVNSIPTIPTGYEGGSRLPCVCIYIYTTPALRQVHSNYTSAKRPLQPCTGVFTATTGLPCAHQVDYIREGLSLLPHDLDRKSVV